MASKKLTVKIEEGKEPDVSISGTNWSANDIRAVIRIIQGEYRTWRRRQRKKELKQQRSG